MSARLNFKSIAAAALTNAEAICRRILPGGKVVGTEYVVLNPRRADTRPGSFKVNLRTGRWADFATGDRGGDLISLVAWRYGVRQIDAARHLATFLSLNLEPL
ncbi:hypothetical protein [Methylobacterium sp. WSM2598]|uniref:hypothetical protein n=1 Tax=Methylobacterium sp. WSM2598 TaxID=398261 RepID=UPI00036A075B|nr:hypothetical protein [Methylobacterium sp. WSM2598]